MTIQPQNALNLCQSNVHFEIKLKTYSSLLNISIKPRSLAIIFIF